MVGSLKAARFQLEPGRDLTHLSEANYYKIHGAGGLATGSRALIATLRFDSQAES